MTIKAVVNSLWWDWFCFILYIATVVYIMWSAKNNDLISVAWGLVMLQGLDK